PPPKNSRATTGSVLFTAFLSPSKVVSKSQASLIPPVLSCAQQKLPHTPRLSSSASASPEPSSSATPALPNSSWPTKPTIASPPPPATPGTALVGGRPPGGAKLQLPRLVVLSAESAVRAAVPSAPPLFSAASVDSTPRPAVFPPRGISLPATVLSVGLVLSAP